MLVSYPVKRNRRLVSCVKTSEAPAIAKTNDDSNKQGSLEKNSQRNATFPNGFEDGDFEMHLKRNIGVAKPPFTSSTPPPPPIPSPPMEVSAAVSPAPSPSKSSVEKTTPFTNVSFRNSSKLAALEASGASGYVLVASPTVGSFRRNRTVKGKKQSPICKESDVAGEVLKLLFDDGDAVGYGDPLIAVLPSFHAIN